MPITKQYGIQTDNNAFVFLFAGGVSVVILLGAICLKYHGLIRDDIRLIEAGDNGFKILGDIVKWLMKV